MSLIILCPTCPASIFGRCMHGILSCEAETSISYLFIYFQSLIIVFNTVHEHLDNVIFFITILSEGLKAFLVTAVLRCCGHILMNISIT